MVLGEDVGRAGGVFRVTQGLADEFGPFRVMDTPLAESLIVGAAIGLSVNGMRPVAEIQFADFIPPAFDQIVNEAARFYYRSNGAWKCPLTIRAPYGAVPGGALYHSQSVEAWFCNTPGLKVVAPTFPADAKGMIKSAIRDPNPVLFLEHKRTYRLIKEDVPEEDYSVPLGEARVHREGTDLTVVSYGLMLYTVLEVAEQALRGAWHRGRGRRAPDAVSAGQGEDPRLRKEDREVPGRLGGEPDGFGLWGDSGHRRAGGVRVAGWAGDAPRSAGRAGGGVREADDGLLRAFSRRR